MAIALIRSPTRLSATRRVTVPTSRTSQLIFEAIAGCSSGLAVNLRHRHALSKDCEPGTIDPEHGGADKGVVVRRDENPVRPHTDAVRSHILTASRIATRGE